MTKRSSLVLAILLSLSLLSSARAKGPVPPVPKNMSPTLPLAGLLQLANDPGRDGFNKSM